MRLSIIGTGYVGLVTGACLANLGHDVVCVDIDSERINNLRKGVMPFYEPGLREIVELNQQQRRLMFTTDTALAVENSDVVFIAVGTPSDDSGKADLKYVFAVADDIAKSMNGYKVVVTKSTVPVGTSHKLKKYIAEKTDGRHVFDVVSNPEFLREGDAVNDFMVPDRVVIGAESDKAEEIMRDIYKSIERTGRSSIIVTDVKTSELIKYASNGMLAARISFVNQLSALCEKVGADIKMVAKGMGLDHRIGPKFLQAGVGYGGSCFPKDVRALIHTLKENDCNADLVEAVEAANERQKLRIVDKIKKILPDPAGKKVAVWGLAFKPKTDDMREAPSIVLVRALRKAGIKVAAFDPVAEGTARKIFDDIEFAETPMTALEGAHLLIVVTEWDLFRELDKEKMKGLMAEPNIIDGRNMFFPDDFRHLGFNYVGVGR